MTRSVPGSNRFQPTRHLGSCAKSQARGWNGERQGEPHEIGQDTCGSTRLELQLMRRSVVRNGALSAIEDLPMVLDAASGLPLRTPSEHTGDDSWA